MRKSAVIIIVIVLIGLIGVGVAMNGYKKDTTSSDTQTTQTQQTTTTSTLPVNSTNDKMDASNDSDTSAAMEITYTDNGFSPKSLTVAAGSTVTVINNATATLQFNSDPHPSHTANPELNVGAVEKGKSQTFTVTTKGTWGYHNHFNPSDTGTLIVQ